MYAESRKTLMNRALMNMRKTMTDYLEEVLGEDWVYVFNVEDYFYLVEEVYLDDDYMFLV
jgi:hypothetical protein